MCDAVFMKCILSPTCRSCFENMQANNVDWTNVVPDTPCQDVLGFLVSSGHCSDVRQGGAEEEDTFCSAFDSCVVWEDDDDVKTSSNKGKQGEDAENATVSNNIDCTTLTECKWDGMHEHFLGDGVCHDAMPGCYNSKACNYDGGDCCKDTCEYLGDSSLNNVLTGGDSYGECGIEGYACRDPSSIHCQPALARASKEFCANEGEEEGSSSDMFDDDEFKKSDEVIPSCPAAQSVYRLIQYDSWGDGWDSTVMTLKERLGEGTVYSGGLQYGSQGTVHICLSSKEPKCYEITVQNGIWGNEISWELRPENSGAPVLAAGGSPSECNVPLGGVLDDCPNTCDASRPETNVNDPDYQSYKDMEACIEKKCLIQVGNCSQDQSCTGCMQESSPDYCVSNDNFNTLIDCTMCSCAETQPAYCEAKAASGISSASGSTAGTHEGNIKVKPAETQMSGSTTGGTAVCGPKQTMQGTTALVKFSECAKVDQMMAMVTEFDNDNFGMLDVFEDCAHTFSVEPAHGGKKAMDCMNILHGLIFSEEDGYVPATNALGDLLPPNIGKAVSTLADHLYHDAESFCDCSGTVNKMAPMCSSFVNFKTLLYESIDACKSLDQIDCAAWEEFYIPCKDKIIDKYDAVNFDSADQCGFVQNSCGGVGPFPAFRRLDCGKEIAKSAWDFHIIYERGCLKSTSQSSSSSSSSSSNAIPMPSPTPYIPKPVPHMSPSSSTSTEKKAYTPSNANGSTDERKPYLPDERKPYLPSYTSPDSSSEITFSSDKKTHHFLRNSLIIVSLASVGLYVYKKRREDFNYVRFRQLREARNYAGGGGDYANVSMADSCSFEPPSLPPTPSANMI